jgi:hypothetical protein
MGARTSSFQEIFVACRQKMAVFTRREASLYDQGSAWNVLVVRCLRFVLARHRHAGAWIGDEAEPVE